MTDIDKRVFKDLAMTDVKTQSEELADRIKGMIVSGEFPEGYQFPNENHLCKMLNVGRGTLREAYKILDTSGFISRTKQGTFVREKEEISRFGNLKASLEMADSKTMTDFIIALEPEAIYLLTKRVTEDQLRRIRELMDECKDSRGNEKKLKDCNYKLHEYMRNCCGNELIICALSAYYDVFCNQVTDYFYEDNEETIAFNEKSLEIHEELWDALIARDADRARDVSRKHLQKDVIFRTIQLEKEEK